MWTQIFYFIRTPFWYIKCEIHIVSNLTRMSFFIGHILVIFQNSFSAFLKNNVECWFYIVKIILWDFSKIYSETRGCHLILRNFYKNVYLLGNRLTPFFCWTSHRRLNRLRGIVGVLASWYAVSISFRWEASVADFRVVSTLGCWEVVSGVPWARSAGKRAISRSTNFLCSLVSKCRVTVCLATVVEPLIIACADNAATPRTSEDGEYLRQILHQIKVTYELRIHLKFILKFLSKKYQQIHWIWW